jgi:hypothetical protein
MAVVIYLSVQLNTNNMRITVEYYGQKFVWESQYGTDGLPFMGDNKIDETPIDDIIEKFAALLVAGGWLEQTIKDTMYEYGRTEFPEEV